MREPFPLLADHVLVCGGLCEATRRDLHKPRDWCGLTGCDAAILSAWVETPGRDLVELHTDVVLGAVPGWLDEVEEDWLRRQAESAHPLRADAVALTGSGWILLEVKPEAGYQALGQVLTYRFYAGRCCEQLAGCRAGVVTNRVQPCIRPVYDHFEIEVHEVGGVISSA